MDRKLGGLTLAAALLCGCGGPKEVNYASYDDCILGELNGGQSNMVARVLIDTCKRKHPAPPKAPTPPWSGYAPSISPPRLKPIDHDPFKDVPQDGAKPAPPPPDGAVPVE